MTAYKAIKTAAPMSGHPAGYDLLRNPRLNKGTAFTEAERRAFRLEGLLPPAVTTMALQVARRHAEIAALQDDLQKYLVLSDLHERNETLYYAILMSDPAAYMPLVYTPTVGEACQRFAHIFRQPRGMYLPITARAPDVLRQLDRLEINRINQLVVEPTLRTTRDPNVFAIGDCAARARPGTSTTVPPRAQAAHQEASHMARQIERRLRGQPLRPYTYRDFGSLVSLGKWSTVGNLMGFLSGRGIFVEGVFAQIMYRSLRLLHERAINGTPRAVLGVLARALAQRTGPQVKLHQAV